MHDAISHSSTLRLGIAVGVPLSRLSALLSLQREQEPEAAITISETSDDELITGLRGRRYDAGMSLHGVADPSLCSQPLWYESMAVAIPLCSPLLDRTELSINDLQGYPVFRWHAETCPLLDQRLSSVLRGQRQEGREVTSFEMMALWVAAGYGVGVTAQSRIVRAHAWGLCMRPLSDDGPYEIVTHLVRPANHSVSERFERRALRIANAR
ncbi:MAG: LysR substrate-binding domain-containing protein [Burkholderiaceae bacterium]